MACQVSITWCFLLSPVRYHIHPAIIEPITDSLRAALFSDVYHFSIGMGGLAYIGLGLGFLLSAIVGAKLSDRIYVYVCQGCLVLTMLIEVLLYSLLTEMQDRVNPRCVCLPWYLARSLSQWGSCEIDSLFSLSIWSMLGGMAGQLKLTSTSWCQSLVPLYLDSEWWQLCGCSHLLAPFITDLSQACLLYYTS